VVQNRQLWREKGGHALGADFVAELFTRDVSEFFLDLILDPLLNLAAQGVGFWG